MRRLAALIALHRRRVARLLFALSLCTVAWQLLPSVPRQTELEFSLGSAHRRVVELRVGFERGGEELHGVSFGFPEGAPRTLRHSVSLPAGDYLARCELRERGGASRLFTRHFQAPAEGVVRIALEPTGLAAASAHASAHVRGLR